MDCNTPGFPVLQHLLELAQNHVHCVGDAIQPSHPLSFPSPASLNFSQPQGLSNELALRIRWPKYWSFSFSISSSNEYSGLIFFRIDWLDLLAFQGTLKSFLLLKVNNFILRCCGLHNNLGLWDLLENSYPAWNGKHMPKKEAIPFV